MSQMQIPTTGECVCPKATIIVPVTGLSLGLDLSGIQTGIEPGPEGTHLVSRNGELVWEPFSVAECGVSIPDNLFVSLAGDDANDGLTPETAFLTISAAVNSTKKYPNVGKLITINIHDGTYTGNIVISGRNNYKELAIKGVSSETTIIEGHILVLNHMHVSFENIHVKSDNMHCVYAMSFSQLDIDNCIITHTNKAGYTIRPHLSSYISIGNLTVNCTSYVVFFGQFCSTIDLSKDVVVKGSVVDAVVALYYNSTFTALASSRISGTVTGKKYNCNSGSIVQSNGKTLPGSLNGVVVNYSTYI